MSENHNLVESENPIQTRELTDEFPNNNQNQVTISKYEGPLPPPSYLREYNEIFPGAAEIILGMAQKEQEHRHIADIEEINRDRAEVEHEAKLNFLGVRSARLISVLFILASTFLIYTGNPITGSILGAGTLISLVSTFIYGTRKKNQKLQSDSSKTSSDMPSLPESQS